MSMDEIETRFCQYVEDILNRHHLDDLADYMTADVVVHARCLAGLAGVRQLVAGCERLPRLSRDHRGVGCSRWSGDGSTDSYGYPLRDLHRCPSDGRRVRVSAFGAWRERYGQCAEQWLQLDLLELLHQLDSEFAPALSMRS